MGRNRGWREPWRNGGGEGRGGEGRSTWPPPLPPPRDKLWTLVSLVDVSRYCAGISYYVVVCQPSVKVISYYVHNKVMFLPLSVCWSVSSITK